MQKINVTGSTTTDMTVLENALKQLILSAKTTLFDEVATNEAGNTLTVYKNSSPLFAWDKSGSTAIFSIYVDAENYVTLSGIPNGCPTFLLDFGGVIYIARGSSNTADVHTSWCAIAPTSTGAAAFLVHTGTSSGNLGQNVYCVAYGDQTTPNTATSTTPNTAKPCTAWYPLPTNCAIGAANWVLDIYPMAHSAYPLTTIGQATIGGAAYYTNGYYLMRDRSGV